MVFLLATLFDHDRLQWANNELGIFIFYLIGTHFYGLMANSSLKNSTQILLGTKDDDSDHTITFVIGFSVLMLFLLMGVAASAFLCITLKKDPYLWPTETNRQAEEEENCGGTEKLTSEMADQESTQM